MKLLFIHNYYQYIGGEETYINSLSQFLVKKKHRIIKYYKDSKQIITILDKIKTSIGLFYSLKVERELSNLIEKEKPDIALFFNIFPLITPTAYFVCRRYNIPIVQRISSYKYICPKGVLFYNKRICHQCVKKKFKHPAILNKCYSNSLFASLFFTLSFYLHKEIIKSFNYVDLFYFPTKFIKNYYIRYAKIDPKKALVIPTFAFINIIRNWKLSKLDQKIIPYKNKYFLFVGRLVEEKGILNLIQVFKNLKKQKLVIIGDGYLSEYIAKQTKLDNNIIYLGPQPRKNVLQYIKFSRCVIIPSIWYDVLPNVFLESLFLNKPIILSNVPSLKFIKGNGILKFESNDLVSLKKSIQLIISKKIKTSYDELKSKFSEELHYKKLINQFKMLYEKKRK